MEQTTPHPRSTPITMTDSDIAIRVENLSKRYRLGADAPYYRMTEAVAGLPRLARRTARRLTRSAATAVAPEKKPAHNPRPDLWALKDVSFEVKKGEVLGIIGRNGAGKSTLLKILSRITEPTHGRATLKGRVGSLLEVGTGFHPELTGRENIYLNGAVLGMSRREVNARFNDIVDFSELADFLDTPVKRYSTGMVTRLGFAVAAHLQPEILIVDEVLAVGDAQFQKKCLGKMDDVAKSGRTVLFVSHNMAAVEALCGRAVLLSSGQVICEGETSNSIEQYREAALTDHSSARITHSDNSPVRIVSSRVFGLLDSQRPTSPMTGQPLSVELDYQLMQTAPIDRVRVRLQLFSRTQQLLFTLDTKLTNSPLHLCSPEGIIRCNLDMLPVTAGKYIFALYVWIGETQVISADYCTDVFVQSSDFYKSGRVPDAKRYGPILVKHNWSAAALGQ